MKCCPVCFGDRGLRNEIFPIRSKVTGICDYCGSKDQRLLDARELADVVGLVVNIYQVDSGGKPLAQCLREDWGLFDHERMDNAHAKELLGDILDDGELVRQLFVPSKQYESDRLSLHRWEKLRDELMYENRFFPTGEIDLDWLSALLSLLIMRPEETPTTWYRARIQNSEEILPVAQMGAPPRRVASHGRANPAGIPYLYLGSSIVTAISEVRPHTGELACVADFTTPQNLKLVDLRSPRKTVSPFMLSSEIAVGHTRSDIGFLDRLGEELTRPVLPQSAAIDYIPSQYLCEFIKKCKFDGVAYRSSVSDGINLALFNPALATPGAVRQQRVAKVSVTLV
jgi:hypothetical protein